MRFCHSSAFVYTFLPIVVNLARDFPYWDRARRSHYQHGWARRLVKELNRLLSGEMSPQKWFEHMRTYVPKAAIVV